MFEILSTDLPLACFLVPFITLKDNFFERVGAFNFVHGNFSAGHLFMLF